MPFISTTNFRSRSARVFVSAFLLVAAITFAGLVISARAWMLRDKASTSTVINASSKSSLVPPSTRQRIEGEIITLSPHGFEPRQITRPPGTFLLVVGNESRLPLVTLRLNDNLGLPILNVLVARERRIWSEIVNLPPGNYRLTEATHPEWICNITIR